MTTWQCMAYGAAVIVAYVAAFYGVIWLFARFAVARWVIGIAAFCALSWGVGLVICETIKLRAH